VVAILVPIILLGLLFTVQIWAQATLKVGASGDSGGIIKIITLPLRLIARVVTPGVNYIAHELSKAASHVMHPLAHWLDDVTAWVYGDAVAVGDFAESAAHGFARTTTVVLPREIGKATRPISRKAAAAWAAAAAAAAALARYKRATDHLIHGQLLPQIHRLTHALDVTIPHALGGIRSRVGEVETQLAHPTRVWLRRLMYALLAAGLLGEITRVIARKFPWLFCRQVKGVGKRICSLDSDLLQSLLADTLLFTGAFSIVAFGHSVEEFEAVATPAIKGFVTEVSGLAGSDYLGPVS
jgi:hypothetical protein